VRLVGGPLVGWAGPEGAGWRAILPGARTFRAPVLRVKIPSGFLNFFGKISKMVWSRCSRPSQRWSMVGWSDGQSDGQAPGELSAIWELSRGRLTHRNAGLA
jgi:hypothetical protein